MSDTPSRPPSSLGQDSAPGPFRDAIRAGYDRWSQIYDHDLNPLLALEAPVIRARISADVGRALDLGCGTGRHALMLAGLGAEVSACDFSAGMLEEARQKPGAEEIDFVEADVARGLPFAQDHFDLIVSGLMLEHVADLPALFREISRVLRPGQGRALLSTMHPAMFLRGSQARFTDPETGAIVAPGSHPHSTSDILMAGLEAGLALEHVSEHAPTAELAEHFPRCAKYVDYPMLLVVEFSRGLAHRKPPSAAAPADQSPK